MMLVWASNDAEKIAAAEWLRGLTPHVVRPFSQPNFQIACVLDGIELRGAIMFTDWFPEYATMQVSIAGTGAGWLTRGILRQAFGYAFHSCGVNKLWCSMRHDVPHVLQFNRRLGFRPEGTLKDQYGPGVHAVVSRLTRGEWRRTPYYCEAT